MFMHTMLELLGHCGLASHGGSTPGHCALELIGQVAEIEKSKIESMPADLPDFGLPQETKIGWITVD